MRRVALLAAVVGLFPAAAAHGHAVVQPGEARPADPQVYRLTVPNEMEMPTVDVRLRVPKGIDFALVETPPPGWKGEIVRDGDAISEIRWTGGSIPPEQYATFRFLVRNPVEEGEISWPVVQRYADGSAQRWIGPTDSDEPASRTRISESATPQDTIAVNGERVAAAKRAEQEQQAAAPAAAARAPRAEAKRDTMTVALAAGAFVLAAIALGDSLLRRRPA